MFGLPLPHRACLEPRRPSQVRSSHGRAVLPVLLTHAAHAYLQPMMVQLPHKPMPDVPVCPHVHSKHPKP